MLEQKFLGYHGTRAARLTALGMEARMRQVVKLKRTWGTTDAECHAFLHDLFRHLYGWDGGHGATSIRHVVDPDVQEVVVEADNKQQAWVTVLLAAARADPAWRRLYRLTE